MPVIRFSLEGAAGVQERLGHGQLQNRRLRIGRRLGNDALEPLGAFVQRAAPQQDQAPGRPRAATSR